MNPRELLPGTVRLTESELDRVHAIQGRNPTRELTLARQGDGRLQVRYPAHAHRGDERERVVRLPRRIAP